LPVFEFEFEFECFAVMMLATQCFHGSIPPCPVISGSLTHTDVTYLAQGVTGFGNSLDSRG
jgi:hypothetical protein